MSEEKVIKAKELMNNLVLFCDDELAETVLVKTELIKSFEECFPDNDSISEDKISERAKWKKERNEKLVQVLKLVIEDLENKKTLEEYINNEIYVT